MSYWDYKEDPDKVEKKLKRCSVCGAKGRLSIRSHMGKHWLDDRIWVTAYCTGCDAKTDESEGTRADENVIKIWNRSAVNVDESTIKRIAEIKKLKAENARLRRKST
ncbi:hypothetical protein LCGC14_1451140 [marine sediment metagenome]|uniref:Uncharacterized protein n=1 Tax=marine sediment metagenome TaxID=412755 RepID=A0A0F9K466_9ZZZZ